MAYSLHEHRLAPPQDWPWLPTRPGGRSIPHPFCVDCGLIKAIGSEKPLDKGTLVNVIAELSDLFTATGRKVAEVQKRLIHRRLRDLAADDAFSHTRAGQVALLVEAFSKYTEIPPDVVVSHLQQLRGVVTPQRG